MDLLMVSSIYHAGGTMLLLRLAYLGSALLLLMVVQRWMTGRWLTVARFVRWSVAFVGLILAAWLVAVELWVFRAGCSACVVASAALLAGFLLGCRPPAWRALAGVAVLLAGSLGFLFPFGTIPKVFAVSEPAPEAVGYSALRLRGDGELLVQEFGDFQCPACAQMDRSIERLLERNEGQFRLVYRHLPLRSIHPWAEPAALASECAAWQGRFWETKRLLFRQHADLGTLLGDLDGPEWDLPDADAFRVCVEGGFAAAAVQEDLDEARRLGLRSTPSVLIGQMLVVGSAPVSRLEAVLQAARMLEPPSSASSRAMGSAVSGCGDGAVTAPCAEPSP